MKKKKKKRKWEKILSSPYTWGFLFVLLLVVSYLEANHTLYIEKYFRDFLFYPSTLMDEASFSIDIEQEVKQENEELKKLLNLGESLTDYEVKYATVVERNSAYWWNTVTINKGKKDGIEKGMAVVDYYGLVGEVEEVSHLTSVVKLVTNQEKYNATSVKIVGEEEWNKIMMPSHQKLIIEGISKTSSVKVGDKVTTSGLSGNFPSGIPIGTIQELSLDHFEVSKIATVKCLADLEHLRFVAILGRKTE